MISTLPLTDRNSPDVRSLENTTDKGSNTHEYPSRGVNYHRSHGRLPDPRLQIRAALTVCRRRLSPRPRGIPAGCRPRSRRPCFHACPSPPWHGRGRSRRPSCWWAWHGPRPGPWRCRLAHLRREVRIWWRPRLVGAAAARTWLDSAGRQRLVFGFRPVVRVGVTVALLRLLSRPTAGLADAFAAADHRWRAPPVVVDAGAVNAGGVWKRRGEVRA